MKNISQAKKNNHYILKSLILKYFRPKWQKGKCRIYHGKCKPVNDQCFKQNIPIR